jgi:hypothetical protein
MKKIWVVCPCYFDIASFRQLHSETLKAVSKRTDWKVQFLVIDDTAGRDPEIAQCSSLAGTRALQAPFNLGHQKAIVFGLRSILNEVLDDDYLVTLDSDGEDRPGDIPALLETLEKHPQDLVLARRTQRSEGLKFRISYQIYRVFFRLLTGKGIKTGNFAAYSGRTLKAMIHHPHFDRCYSMSLFSSKIPSQMVPLPRGHRFFGQSKMNMLSLVRHGLNMLMPFLDHISFRGMLFFSFIAIGGFLASLAILYVKLFTTLAIPGWTSYVLLGVLTLSASSFGNLLVLFFMYTQMDSHYLMDLLKKNGKE